MATKRLSPVPKSRASNSELSLAQNEFKSLTSALSQFFPSLSFPDFKTISEALTAFISLSKLFSSKLHELFEDPLHISLQQKYDELKSIMIEENSKMQKVLQENEFLSKQLPILNNKIETYRSRFSDKSGLNLERNSLEKPAESDLVAKLQDKIQELEAEIDGFKEKVRMNSQLTQALSDSVKREEQLKKQCDELLESLHSALAEDEKLALRIAQMEENADSTKKVLKTKEEELIKARKGYEGRDEENGRRSKGSELARAIEMDLEKGGNRWRQLKYSFIEGISDRENFELLRRIIDYRDMREYDALQNLHEKEAEVEALRNSISRELAFGDLDSKKQSFHHLNIEDALADRENDIKDLLKDYERLQTQYRDLEKQSSQKDFEILQLREKIAAKANQLVNIYQTQDFNNSIPEELHTMRKQYLEVLNINTHLSSQLSIIRTRKFEFADTIKEFLESKTGKEEFVERIKEAFEWRLSIEIQSLETHLVNELRKRIEKLEEGLLNREMINESLRIEVNAIKSLWEEDKFAEKDAKSNKNEWKKFRREHLVRLEKIYNEQIGDLKAVIQKYGKSYKEKEEKLVELTQNYEKEIRDLTLALKKEHESKKKIAELFTKEKETCDKIKESTSNQKSEYESLCKKYSDSKYALEESNKRIFKLEQDLQHTLEIEELLGNKERAFQDQLQEAEITKSKLYAEITRLNKQLQEFESEQKKLTLEKKSSVFFCEESRDSFFKELQLKEEKISQLDKENFRLKNEIFEVDVRLKSYESDLEKMKLLKRNLSEMEKKVLSFDILEREKNYIEEENVGLRDEIKNSQGIIQGLRFELRSLSGELVEIRSQASLGNRKSQETPSRESQEEIINMQKRLESISKDFSAVKVDLERVTDEKNALIRAKKIAEAEILALKEKCGSRQKEIPNDFAAVKERVQEIEMRYESLEACQDEMILTARKLYKSWCSAQKIPQRRMGNLNDPTREAIFILEHIIQEYNKSINKCAEDLSEYSQRVSTVLNKIESQPDSAFRSHSLRLLAENIEMKRDSLIRHQKALEDDKVFEQLKNVDGVNDWVLVKWKDTEKDVSRLRDQLLQVTLELEKRIKLAKDVPNDLAQQLEQARNKLEDVKSLKSEEIEYLNSEKSYFKQRCMELEQDLLRLNSEKIDKKVASVNNEKELDNWKKALLDIHYKLTGRIPGTETAASLVNSILTWFENSKDRSKSTASMNEYISEIDLLKEEIEYYKTRSDATALYKEIHRLEDVIKSYKAKEAVAEKKPQDSQNKQGDSGLISALYEEKRLREELEEELTEKCNMIESILKEFEENKKFLKVRECEYQELLTRKDEEILKLKCELSDIPRRFK